MTHTKAKPDYVHPLWREWDSGSARGTDGGSSCFRPGTFACLRARNAFIICNERTHGTHGLRLLLELKGWETDEDRARHNAARRWVSAVNNWGEMGRWAFHVCRDPHLLEGEIAGLLRE